jgi:hypothetical protein
MTAPSNEHHANAHHSAGQADTSADRTRYPENHVVAVLDTNAQVTKAVAALTSGGFMDSEIQYGTGVAAADELDASTGRTGLTALLIRLAERIGVADEEMEMKDRYEQAMRDNKFVFSVAAATEERKQRATEMLRAHGAHTIAYYGKRTIEFISPPNK